MLPDVRECYFVVNAQTSVNSKMLLRRRPSCKFTVASLLCLTFLYMFYRQHMIGSIHKIGFHGEVKRWFGDPGVLSASNRKISDLLVIGYLRGGTTLMGELLALRNDTFYVYEPLHKFGDFRYFKPGYECSMNNETCRKSNRTDGQVLDVIRAIYNCDYSHFQDQLRTFQHLKSRGIESLNDQKWKMSFPECQGKWNGCPKKYLSQCSKRKSIVSKVPRLSLSLASTLLDTISHLKIIHLLRDPRAIMNSRTNLKWTPVPGGALSLCNKMTDDYLESVKLKTKYPGRLYTVFYEDLATHPLETFKNIFNFAGYKISANDHLHLAQRTASSKRSSPGNTYCRNSSSVAFAWKNRINNIVLNETNKACSNLYRLLGYPQ
ncbi:carbohydrate sulfotransferase 2-like [Mizuhopecten yessoensis]|uniref:Carbohydrate sulfotransferase 1 n=1 Tax=Mizuhopecten yessoensis TaxID=6573 RepID=A0A210Q541_MIZYE|nr:carbohydrate sulfotransferase 2-like [Mizuhopecten yessoensis]OWF43860.1 Carbohydrate sulfotransferase 1 [Mizuhopecten yessoensis]